MVDKTVLNKDQSIHARFQTLYDMSNELKMLCRNGEKVYPGFTSIIADLWYVFYSPTIETQTIKNTSPFHGEVIEQLINQETFQNWRIFTELDELFSILLTLVVGEELLKQIQSSSKQYLNSEITKNHIRLNTVNHQLQNKSLSLLDKERLLFQQKAIKHTIKQLESRIQNKKRMTVNMELISLAIRKQSQAIVETIKGVHQLSSLNGQNVSSVPLKDQILYVEHLAKKELLKNIAEMTGRFKKIAMQKQKMKQRQTMERNEMTFSQELSQLLPLEYAHLVMPQSKLDFYRRFAETQTFAFGKKGKERKGRGPMIICMDESSSMSSLKAEAKAFCLALLFIAKKQKRDIAIIPFATDIGEVMVFKKGKATAEQVLRFSNGFLTGGTNYEKPLMKSLEILNESSFNRADILFVTDGASFLPSSFIEYFNDLKKKRQFECTSIVLTNLYNAVDQELLEKFSDKILNVHNLFEAEDVFAIY